jgi:hypothetical protein
MIRKRTHILFAFTPNGKEGGMQPSSQSVVINLDFRGQTILPVPGGEGRVEGGLVSKRFFSVRVSFHTICVFCRHVL